MYVFSCCLCYGLWLYRGPQRVRPHVTFCRVCSDMNCLTALCLNTSHGHTHYAHISWVSLSSGFLVSCCLCFRFVFSLIQSLDLCWSWRLLPLTNAHTHLQADSCHGSCRPSLHNIAGFWCCHPGLWRRTAGRASLCPESPGSKQTGKLALLVYITS